MEDNVLNLDFEEHINYSMIAAIEVIEKPIEKPVDQFVMRINAGGKEYIDKEGNVWLEDIFSNGNRVSDRGRGDDFANTDDDALYELQRLESGFSIPLKNGEYNVPKKYLSL